MRFILFSFVLSLSSLAYSCPSGQYEQCLLPRPWGGCAQKLCVPNGRTVTSGLTGALGDLNQGLIRLENETIHAPQTLSSQLAQTASSINWPQFHKIDWATAAFIASFLANGSACIASDGISPGVDLQGAAVVCTENACACAAISLVAAIQSRSNLSDSDKASFKDLLDHPKLDELMARPAIQRAIDSELNALQIFQAPAKPWPLGSPQDRDGNDLTFTPEENDR